MQNRNEIRKRANRLFFIKMTINTLLIVFGTVFISLFLQHMQHQTSLSKQRHNSEIALTEVSFSLEENTRNATAMSYLYHNGNQDMLDDLQDMLTNVLFGSLTSSGREDRYAIFRDIADRADVDYLFLLGSDGNFLISSFPEDDQKTPAFHDDTREKRDNSDLSGLLSSENFSRLLEGTRTSDGDVLPVVEDNENGRSYFYSVNCRYDGKEYVLALGVNAVARGVQSIGAPVNVGLVLSQAAVGNDGFLFAVNPVDGSFLYYENSAEVLTGKNAQQAGLSSAALQDGYDGVETINGTKYYCVSKALEDGTVLCAATDTDQIFSNDRRVLSWTIASFLLVMVLCLIYPVIVRNNYIRNAADTKKLILQRWLGSPVIFDVTIFEKVFPLMITGVFVIFAISFYSQTLLEISQTAGICDAALEEVYERYQLGVESRQVIQQGHDNRYLAKASLIAYMLEEDPSVLNETSDREYSFFNDDGVREYHLDSEGNRLKSVSSSARLQELCKMNSLDSIYIFDENGRTIATNTANWYFTIGQDPMDQSYPFRQVLDGRKDLYIQSMQISDIGENAQYIGVAFHYYTTLDEQGNTVYLSRRDYENQDSRPEESDPAQKNLRPITAHRSLLQVGLVDDLEVLTVTNTESILSSNILSNGSFLLFGNSEDHICLYSDFEENIGMKAADMGISQNAFTLGEYYGFPRVNGVVSFLYSRYGGGDRIAALIPRSEMYQSRTRIALNTALTSLLLILFLSVTVTLTTEEEEILYSTINEEAERPGLDSAIFKMILPYGHRSTAAKVSSRWNRHRIPWLQKSPEQKLSLIIQLVCTAFVLYGVIAIAGAETFFPEHSVIRYILSGEWDRGFNIFALSGCALVLIAMRILVVLLQIPLLSVSSLLGTRSETIGNLLLSVVKYGVVIGTFFYCLYLLGMDPTSLLASAGVLSLIIGFGAQSLIKDILAGIFFVFEGEFRIGDIVTIDDFRGTVIDIGLRTTKILGVDGNIKIFNNSEISGVLNMTKETSFAYCEISIEYGQDIDYVEAVLRRELPKLWEDNPDILSEPTCLGVQTLGDSGIEMLIEVECNEENLRSVRRYVNKELLKIFYRNDIQVPFPNVTVSTLNMEGRKTMADLKDFDPGVLDWLDTAQNKTRSITVTSLGEGMEHALRITEQLAVYHRLDHKAMLQLRLLAEELFGLLRNIAGDTAAIYWIAVNESLYELHMRTQLHMTREIREQLLGVSTSGENTAAEGFMGRLQDMIFVKLLLAADNLDSDGALQDSPISDPEAGQDTDITEEWTMSQYKSDIDCRRNQSTDAAEQWDELEKSIVAQLADEVKVSMRGFNVEITIFKTFFKD